VRSPKGDCTLQCSNLLSIAQFKQMYIDKLGPDAAQGLKVEKIRMFCLGKELKDELFLYTYDIVDEMTVQVMITKGA
jgi:Ubiquitin family